MTEIPRVSDVISQLCLANQIFDPLINITSLCTFAPIMRADVLYCMNAWAAILSTLPLAAAAPGSFHSAKRMCHYLPGDDGWPNDEDWSNLNHTVGGRLIRGTPLAQPCYRPDLDPVACTEVQDSWTDLTP